MSAARYCKFLKLCEKWPLDPSKGEKRDFGVMLRRRVGKAFSKGDMSEIADTAQCDRMYESLDALHNDKFKKQYPYHSTVGAFGLNFEETKSCISEKSLKEIQLEGQGFFSRNIGRLRLNRKSK